MTSVTSSIVEIQDLLDRWRALGHLRLDSGVEMIGRFPDETTETWTHVLFPGLTVSQLDALERRTGGKLPSSLRAFYRLIGGMTLFVGAFRMAGARPAGIRCGAGSLCPDDLVQLNHDLDVMGWKSSSALAFAANGWDGSVHVVGMGHTPDEVLRIDRATGTVLESHDDVFACVAARLTRLDELMLA